MIHRSMALSKPIFLRHFKTLTKQSCSPTFSSSSSSFLRFLSFATPEEAAADRRRRKRRLRIEPPHSSLTQHHHQQQHPKPQTTQNPNAPKLPEHASALSGNRLNLHNKILKLIRENDLDEAALYTRHSIYSNCKPTVFTCNAVMAAQLRQARYADLLQLHRFITQAGVAPNVITYNLVITAYLDCRKPVTALEQYKLLVSDAPFNPSPTTFRILVKGLVDNDKLEEAVGVKDEMLEKGFKADPVVYAYLMMGKAKEGDGEGVFGLYEELKEKLGGVVSDGIVYGGLVKGYFLKGMESEAMECFREAVGDEKKVKMCAVGYNYLLDALSKNGKFDEALRLFDRMMGEHNPPQRLSVNLGSFNVMVDGYCAEGRFGDAIEVFKNMGEKRCRPDTLSYNNLIEQLCNNGLLAEGEELYRGMSETGVKPDEFTFVLLMDSCFKEDRPDDAAEYFRMMVEAKLRPNLGVYNRLVEGLVKVGKVDEAKSFFDMMVDKLRMDDGSYKFIMKSLFEVGKHDEVLKIVEGILRSDPSDFTTELQEFVKEELGKEGRAEEVVKLMEDIEREKAEAAAREAEAAERAKASTRAAVSSLLPKKYFLDLPTGEESSASSDTTDNAVQSSFLSEVGQSGKEESVGDKLEEANYLHANSQQVMNGDNVAEAEVVTQSAS